MKLMQHPKHGWHNAYTTAEEEAMRENGWVDAEPIAPKSAPVVEVIPAFYELDREVIAEEPKRKPGRPRKEG